jgi:hypothetical protein
MDRDIAVAKLKALAQGAEIAGKKTGNRGQSPKAKRPAKRGKSKRPR